MTTAETDPTPRSAKAGALHRDLGVLDATMLVMGAMIGSGIFITSAESARLVGAPGWLLVAWALAGLMTISGALASAELAAMMPRAGGQYVFLRVAYGPMFGFLFGWSMFLVVQTGTIAAVSVAFAKFLGVFWPVDLRRREPVLPADRPGALCHQPFHPAARRPGPDRGPDLHQHPGSPARGAHPEHVHLRQDGRPDRPDRHRPDAGRAGQRSRVDVLVVELGRQRLDIGGVPTTDGFRSREPRRSCSCSAWP